MNKITWEDIFNNDIKWHEQTKYMIIDTLKQAEAEGKCCLNPPDKKELYELIWAVITDMSYHPECDTVMELSDEIAEVIAKRIKEGV